MEIIHFETLGCKLNQIETESIADAFSKAGFKPDLGRETSGDNQSDSAVYLPVGIPILSIINTCTVTGKAEQKARRLIRLLLRKYPASPVLVTGCYAEVEQASIAAIDPRVIVFPGSVKGALAELPEFLLERETRNPGEPVKAILESFCTRARETDGQTSHTFALATDTFIAHSRASIKIQDGCNNACSYCRIRLARGKSVSIDAAEAIERIRRIEIAGWKEVVLTGVNLSQYRSRGIDFAGLLARILDKTDSIAIRISSLYPERVNAELAPILTNPRIRPHFHLSVQSGSDRILESMRRPYRAQDVAQAVSILRTVKKNPFLACDIIAGYPGETDEDFEHTLTLCKTAEFAWIHAFPFSPRPGTEAWSMKPHIPERIATERVARLTALAQENRRHYTESWIGKELAAIVEKKTGNGSIHILTENYLEAELLLPPGTATPEPHPGSEIRVQLDSPGIARLSRTCAQ
ncbi:MAG TPA: tRNA (N(6)-L-threonylcarbamoyladenosine(37)-C(2))-methylthiotransferase MtaB [Treponemataceae bacterium]|jgi:threonylcarbamoyladenosine tRNA methylthiotransferase MtaB|nr:tRNA (N(6)-L-threonylcarbamoyladenosine(37)-C(2))-methylthiotransferase MtaB [Treponemataceae bacterium]